MLFACLVVWQWSSLFLNKKTERQKLQFGRQHQISGYKKILFTPSENYLKEETLNIK